MKVLYILGNSFTVTLIGKYIHLITKIMIFDSPEETKHNINFQYP